MKLPNAQAAVVERQKIAEYLLNPAHPDNGGKAAFFTGKGFSADQWEVLAEALRGLTAEGDVTSSAASVHGTKYVVDGPLATPGGDRPIVRTVWIIDSGLSGPRLVTAYPQG